eukprot:scaffold7958_cov133-Isochrysis_galbana.AAC.6
MRVTQHSAVRSRRPWLPTTARWVLFALGKARALKAMDTRCNRLLRRANNLRIQCARVSVSAEGAFCTVGVFGPGCAETQDGKQVGRCLQDPSLRCAGSSN